MELIEVAPGIDVERDILATWNSRRSCAIRLMDARIFRDGRWDWRKPAWLEPDERLSYDPERNILFLNFEGMHVRTRDDVDRVRRVFERAARRSAGKSL